MGRNQSGRNQEVCKAASTASAFEERYTKLVFQSLNLLSDGRLRQEQFLGGAAKVQVLRYSAKHSESEVFDH